MPLGLTLIEAQKYARRAEQLAVLKTFAEGELLRRLPFRNLVGGSLSFPAETKLPRVGFRAVNEGYRQSYGVINSDSEFVHLFGGDLDVDRSIVDLQGPVEQPAVAEIVLGGVKEPDVHPVLSSARRLRCPNCGTWPCPAAPDRGQWRCSCRSLVNVHQARVTRSGCGAPARCGSIRATTPAKRSK